MPTIASTSGRLHSEFVRLLFLQAHRETDRFFAASGVQLAHSNSGLLHFRRAALSSQLKAKVGSPSPRLQFYVLIFKNTYSPITLANFSSINLVFIFGCSSSPSNPVYARRVDSSSLVFSLSSHRHSNIGLVYNSRFIDS
jgi:hypothetical protein